MCCLPLPLLKILTTLGAVISAVLSVGILIAVIYVTFDQRQIIDSANQPVIKTILVLFYIVSIVFLVLALCGIYGSIKAKKKNKLAPCLLSAYSVSVVIFFVIFVIMTIVIFAAPPAVFGQSCKKGSSTTFVQNIYNVSQDSYQKFCSSTCPCQLTPENMNSELADYLTSQNKSFGTATDYHINYQQCLQNIDQQSNAILLGSLQEFLHCGGWCEQDQPKFLRFSNINDCVTKQCFENRPACYNEFRDFVLSKGTIMGISMAIASVFALVNMIFICCICFHPMTKTQKHKNFYARMMDTD